MAGWRVGTQDRKAPWRGLFIGVTRDRDLQGGLSGDEGFVGEDAIESGSADGELAGRAELIAAIEFEDILDVLANDGVEGKVGRAGGRMRALAQVN